MHLRTPVSGLKDEQDSSELDANLGKSCSKTKSVVYRMKMPLPVRILVCLALVIFGCISSDAIASDGLIENESNAMEEVKDDIQARSDYPDLDDLNSFFDFEIGPPSITYQHIDDSKPQKSYNSRPNMNKNYYHYDSDSYPTYKKHQYHATPTKRQVVTPGTHYKSSTEKTFVEEDDKISNESKPFLNQANIGPYQVSIVDANSPILSNLGLSAEDLEKLAGYNKHTSNVSMLASDSTAAATYAENPHHNPQPVHSPPQQPNPPAYPPPYDSSNYAPYQANSGERRQGGYSQPPAAAHPPPQGSYDPKSYRSVQSGSSQSSHSHNYPPQAYNPPPPHATYSQPPATYNNPPPPPSYNQPPSQYGNPPAPYKNPPPPSYNQPPSQYGNPPAPYNNPAPYTPQRSSGEPWRQSSHVQVDWDDKQAKSQDNWKNGNYPPHPPPLPYSNTPSNSGSYNSKPAHGTAPEKSGQRYAATYHRPETVVKTTYSSTSGVSSAHSSFKPSYQSSSSYSPSKASPGSGSVSYAASSHYEHPAPASKPGITIRFKAKAPTSHGVSIPLSFSPLDIVKKIIPSLNPLNNKKVTIGITIENKKEEHHHDILTY